MTDNPESPLDYVLRIYRDEHGVKSDFADEQHFSACVEVYAYRCAAEQAEKYRDLIRRMNIENEGSHYGGAGAWGLNTDLQKEIDEALK